MESSKQTDTGTHFKWFTQNFSFELHAGKSASFLFWNIFEFSGQTNNSQFVLMAFMPLILYNSALIKFLCLFLVINTNGGYRIHALLDLSVQNGFRYTRGASETGSAGTGTVCDFITPRNTAPVPTVIRVFHRLI